MARLFTDSFDHYDTAHILNKWSDLGTGGQSIASGVVGATNSCLRIPNNASFTLVKNFPASYGTLTAGVRCRFDAMGSLNRVFTFNDTGSTQLVIGFLNSGQISAFSGSSNPGLGFLATELGRSTAGNLISAQNWAYVEAQVVFATDATGSVTVRVNSQTVLTVTGVRTTQTSNASANQFGFLGMGGDTAGNFDDLYVNDTSGSHNTGFDGDQRIVCVYPGGAGSSTGWSPTGAGANWQCVSDNPPDGDSTYNAASTSGLVDLYTTSTLPNSAQIGAIPAVQMVLDCKTDDGGAATVAPCFGSGGAPLVGSSTSINSSYDMVLQNYGVNPLTSAAWTVLDFSTLQIGAKRVS